MPPKSSAGKEKDLTDEDEVLQAVILADSFNKRFRPLTVGKPRCLLPICNATLLDWTFESLALAGVQEIFVICRSYAELVKAAIRDSKWSKPSSGLKIVPIITAKETYSPGDAMRDIYTHGIITSDFVLVTGDLVSNIRIDEVVRAHKERRRTNKDAIMTMVVKESGAQHRTRSKAESGVFVLDAATSECLHYEPVGGYPRKSIIHIPREILAEHPEVEIRNDFVDCSIDVCSVEVPSLFQDNFDYGDIRRDFVYGVLTSDLLMKNIYCYVAKEGYAARVADTRSYDAISKDILARWTFPLVPDNNYPGDQAYEHVRGNKYIAKDNSVSLSRTCKIGSNTLIGAHTSVADNASISASVIGQRCTIGPGAVLRGAYVFDDTHIGAGTRVETSIIGSNVRIGPGSTVHIGCLVGNGVILGKNARLGKFERVSRKREAVNGVEADDEEDDDEWEVVEAYQDSVTSILGEDSNAVVWPQTPPDEEEDEDSVESYNSQRLMRIGDDALDLDLSDDGSVTDESDSESDSESDLDMHALSRTSSITSMSHVPDMSVSTLHTLHDSAAEHEFRSEVRQSLERAFAEGHSVDNASVELKTLRMASNVPLRRVREAVVEAIVDRIEVVEGDPQKQRQVIWKMVERWGPLVDRIGGVDPVETVEVLQLHLAESPRLPLFGQILAALYQADIVEEDDIRTWHARPSSKGEGLKPGPLRDGMEKCWTVGKRMIEQFDEQESESESESEEEDEVESKGDDESDDNVEGSKGANREGENEEGSEEEETSEEESEEDAGVAVKKASSTVEKTVATGTVTSRASGSSATSNAPSITPTAVRADASSSAPPQQESEDSSGEEETSEEESEAEADPAIQVTSATVENIVVASTVAPQASGSSAASHTPAVAHVEEAASRAVRADTSSSAPPQQESEESSGEEETSEEESEEEPGPTTQTASTTVENTVVTASSTLAASTVVRAAASSSAPPPQESEESSGEETSEEESEEEAGPAIQTASTTVAKAVVASATAPLTVPAGPSPAASSAPAVTPAATAVRAETKAPAATTATAVKTEAGSAKTAPPATSSSAPVQAPPAATAPSAQKEESSEGEESEEESGEESSEDGGKEGSGSEEGSAESGEAGSSSGEEESSGEE